MIDIIYKRPWLTVVGINSAAVLLLCAVIAWWVGDAAVIGKTLVIAPIVAALFTIKLARGWYDKAPDDAVWRKRFLQTGAIWGVVLVILAFILIGIH
ncbi:MAG: hypothetical protein ACTHOI_13085 [Sphingomicrobium sp.]